MHQFCALLKLDLAQNFKFSMIRRFRASTLSDDSYYVHSMLIVSRYGVIMFEQIRKQNIMGRGRADGRGCSQLDGTFVGIYSFKVSSNWSCGTWLQRKWVFRRAQFIKDSLSIWLFLDEEIG
jgi:hypothetical protein